MRAYQYILSQVWAILPEALEIGLNIALREHEPESVQARDGKPMDRTRTASKRGCVAVIPVCGPIFRYADMFTELCGGATVDAIAKDLTAALDDDSVDAIVLEIDSPGGQAAGIGELAAMIRDGTKRKPIIGYTSAHACSAAYWIAAACSEVVAAPTAILGSIGVVLAYPTKGDGKKSVEFVSSQSPNKRPDPSTEKGRSEVQRTVDDLATLFIAAVADYRGVDEDCVVNNFGQGGLQVGQRAVDSGMADRLGSFESVLSELTAASQQRRNSTTPAGLAATTPERVITMADETIQAGAVAGMDDLRKQVAALLDQNKAILAENVTILKERIEVEANAYVTSLIHGKQALSAETSVIKAAFVQLATDDKASPIAGTSRVDMLKSLYASRPAHGLTDAPVRDSAQIEKDLAEGKIQVVETGAPKTPTRPEEVPKSRLATLMSLDSELARFAPKV
jgi:ClpP class serine protease